MLEMPRIRLRLLEEQDLASRVTWVNDPAIRSYLMFDYPLSLAKTQAWFRQTILDPTKIHFSIIDRETDTLIGMTGLLDIDSKHQRAQFYITIGDKNFWGKGLAGEVIAAVTEHGFVELNLNRIYLYTISDNHRARNVYARNGFVHEGVLRQHYYCVGKYQDLTVQSMLKSDWLARRDQHRQTRHPAGAKADSSII